ncbi:hypothetical protein [Peribacillus frigoritolerans]|uniref:hypothetical protein n=1 Tax=Peribacillus frigoritolerans TaxID=450367 RepID=UPI00363683CC
MNKSPITYETEYIYKNGVKIGYVQLKGSAYCHTAWGYLKFYSAAPYDYYANVWVDSFNGKTKRAFTSCASSGGNGWIIKGQTSCYTAQIRNLNPYNALAKAGIYSSSGEHRSLLIGYKRGPTAEKASIQSSIPYFFCLLTKGIRKEFRMPFMNLIAYHAFLNQRKYDCR